jgi:hypothetical protein
VTTIFRGTSFPAARRNAIAVSHGYATEGITILLIFGLWTGAAFDVSREAMSARPLPLQHLTN